MEELFEDIEKLARAERRVAMATLVATRGTSPKREGAKMWVGEEGRILGSVTIGGCVDARVIAESEQALSSFQSRLVEMKLGNEDAWEIGFSCAGDLDVLIEPVDLTSRDNVFELYQAVRAAIDRGKHAVIATPLRESARKLLLIEGVESSGSLGAPELDREAQTVAVELMRRGVSSTVSLGAESMAVFFEVHGPPPTLIVFGAGHVAMPLVSLAHDLGLKTVVVDGRPRFATRERFPDVDHLLIGMPSEIAETLSYTSSTFVVLTAHDYKYDLPVLKVVLPARPAYVGLLGSKRRGAAIKEFLRDGGMDEALLDQLHVPTGLDIGAETAAEIGLSILAEAVALKSGRAAIPGAFLRDSK
ncbi:MAG TPA: XdhC/CoxI family protein [Pyrinomonadaceae bacterium]|nr:XdhC/CoxI family protein [Pyrinomonadaceae bacterium]